jgi:hypothetical protein
VGISNISNGWRPGICTSTTRPTAPYEGQMIYETDTNQVLVYDGSYWISTSPQRNLLFNGAMQVAQRATSATSKTADGYYTADRWKVAISSLGTWTQSVENDAPTGSGFRKSLKMLCTTADASPAAGDYCLLQQDLEGQNVQALRKGTSSAEQITVSFWVKANVTGTYVLFLQDYDNTRSVSKTYSISSSGTWEFKSITFPSDTTGALDNDNAGSFAVRWVLGVGTNWTSGTRNETWASLTLANLAQGQTANVAAATNNYWQITGVQMNVGANASPFEFKDYGRDLEECQRYYWMLKGGVAYSLYATGFARTTGAADFVFHSPVEMRTRPTSVESNAQVMTIPGTGTVAITGISSGDGAALTVGGVYVTGSASSGQHYFIGNNNDSNGYIAFSAEL